LNTVPEKNKCVPEPLFLDNLYNQIKRRLDPKRLDGKAVLVQIPQVPPQLVETEIARNRGYFAYPPHGLFYLSGELERLGVSSVISDLNLEVLKAASEGIENLDKIWQGCLEQIFPRDQSFFICLSFMFDSTFPQLKSVCSWIKDTYPAVPIIVGGVAATADPDRLLRGNLADIVVANEGELGLSGLVTFLRKESQEEPPNLFMLDDEDGRSVTSTRNAFGAGVHFDIREQFNKIDLAEYCKFGSLNNFSRIKGVDVPYATILTRRGCRARCTFCSVRNFNGPGVRTRDVDHVVDEMVDLWQHHDIRHFEWLDDDPLYDRDFALNLFNQIAERLPGATWSANNGMIASSVTPEILAALEKSHCLGFTVGLETGNPEMLRKIKKPATIERFLQFAQMSKDFPGIFYIVNFILGLPTETFGQMLDSFDVARVSKLDWNNFFNFQPLKNTDAYLAYAGLEDDDIDDQLIKRGTTVDFNPNRAGVFNAKDDDGLIRGYAIFDMPLDAAPARNQIREIWFTFNYVANFLRLPALETENETRIENAVKWLLALGHAYQDNPAINCVLYFLERRLGKNRSVLNNQRDAAFMKFKKSEYWSERDREFNFSAFLENEIPMIDPRASRGSDGELLTRKK
jgi:radical SAM superfamily enzyme YgiQ (UPF0313 family)